MLFQQQKKSNQKNAVPRRFFILHYPTTFERTGSDSTSMCRAESSLVNQQGHAELSPLIKLNWRSNRSMISFAKVIGHHKKNVRKLPSRIGLVSLSKGLHIPSFVIATSQLYKAFRAQ
jgi:hypothetical protein